MGRCAAPNCKSSTGKGTRLFRFPKDQDRRAKWIENSGRDIWVPTEHSRLCELHFEESQYELNRADDRKLLKWNAVPTIFQNSDTAPVYQFHFEESQYELNGVDDRKLLNWNTVPTILLNTDASPVYQKQKTTANKGPRTCKESLLFEGNLSSNQPAERENCSIHADHSYCLHSPKTLHETNEKLQGQIKQGIPFKKIRQKKLKPTLHNIYKSEKYQPKVILHRLPKSLLQKYINTVYELSFVEYELRTSAGTSCETLSKTFNTKGEKVTKNKSSKLPLKHKIPFVKPITLHEERCPATLQLRPDMVKELNEILSTVEDVVIRANKLLSLVEETLDVVPLASPETDDHLEMGEISSALVHEIVKENIDVNMCCSKCKLLLSEERIDRDTSIEEPSGKSSPATEIETDWFHNNSEDSQSGGELSLPPSPRSWLIPKIVSVSSMATQSAGYSSDRISPSAPECQGVSKQILSSRSCTEMNQSNTKQTFKSAKHSNGISFPLSLTDINSKEMQINNKFFKFNIKDSLSKLVRIFSHMSQVISLKKYCDQKCFELRQVVNDFGINDIFIKLSIIIKDSVKESEHYNDKAKYILQLISSYSRGK